MLILIVYGSLITVIGWVVAIIITVVVPICKESIGYRLLFLIYNNR